MSCVRTAIVTETYRSDTDSQLPHGLRRLGSKRLRGRNLLLCLAPRKARYPQSHPHQRAGCALEFDSRHVVKSQSLRK